MVDWIVWWDSTVVDWIVLWDSKMVDWIVWWDSKVVDWIVWLVARGGGLHSLLWDNILGWQGL